MKEFRKLNMTETERVLAFFREVDQYPFGPHLTNEELLAYLGDELRIIDGRNEAGRTAHITRCKACAARFAEINPTSESDIVH